MPHISQAPSQRDAGRADWPRVNDPYQPDVDIAAGELSRDFVSEHSAEGIPDQVIRLRQLRPKYCPSAVGGNLLQGRVSVCSARVADVDADDVQICGQVRKKLLRQPADAAVIRQDDQGGSYATSLSHQRRASFSLGFVVASIPTPFNGSGLSGNGRKLKQCVEGYVLSQCRLEFRGKLDHEQTCVHQHERNCRER